MKRIHEYTLYLLPYACQGCLLNGSIPAVRDLNEPGAVRVAPLHGEVNAGQGRGHHDPRVPGGDGGVGDCHAAEHDAGGDRADGADDGDAHGPLDVGDAQLREGVGGSGHEQVLGEVEAGLGDDGGDVRRAGGGGGGGE